MRLVYTLRVGIPASLFLMTIGCLLCLTVIGIPAGLVCFAGGFKVLTIDRSSTCGADKARAEHRRRVDREMQHPPLRAERLGVLGIDQNRTRGVARRVLFRMGGC